MRIMLSERVRSGELVLWTPQFDGEACERSLFITSEINEEFDVSTWKDMSLAVRYSQLSGDFDRFATGDTIPVGMAPYDKDDSAFMARIDPTDYGIWDIRSTAPSPAIRVLGAFAETDVFVALITRLRRDLGGKGSREWALAREAAISRWENLFPGKPRLVGENINDFISKKTVSV